MKIIDVKASYIEIPFPKPFSIGLKPEIVREKAGFTLVKVFTDDGITGIGTQQDTAMGSQYPEITRYINGPVKSFLLSEVIDPFFIEKFSRSYRSRAFGTEVAPRPWSVEMALWDIVGKAARQPVFKLLGAYQDKVKAYASVLEPYPLFSPEEWADFTQGLCDEGFKAVKLHIGWQWSDYHKVLEVVKAIRKKLGFKLEIMIDAVQAWSAVPKYDLRTAIKYARGLEEFDVSFLEEPLPHFNNLDLSAALCATVDIPIAGGGAVSGMHSYHMILEKKALDIIQPDVQYAGGILEVKRIATLAEAYGKVCIPHYFGCGIGLAATLQLIGSTNMPYIEFPYHPPFYTVEYRDTIINEPIRIDKEGYVKIPDKPGLGIELNEKAAKKYQVL